MRFGHAKRVRLNLSVRPLARKLNHNLDELVKVKMKIPHIYPISLLSIVVCIAILFATKIISLREISPALLSLFGTYLGAMLAFRLNEFKELSKKASEERAAINRALFTIARQYNALSNALDVTNSFESTFEKAFKPQTIPSISQFNMSQRLESLEFLLESPDTDLLLRISLEDDRYTGLFKKIEQRNVLYATKIKPELLKSELLIPLGPAAEVKTILGDDLYYELIKASETLISSMNTSVSSLEKNFRELRSIGKKLHPNHSFIAFRKPHDGKSTV